MGTVDGNREKFERSLRQSAETLQPWKEELRHLINGQVRWYDCMSRPELKPDGDIVWNGILLEIAEQKRFEQELQHFQFSIERATDAVFWMDITGRFSYVNEQACLAKTAYMIDRNSELCKTI